MKGSVMHEGDQLQTCFWLQQVYARDAFFHHLCYYWVLTGG